MAKRRKSKKALGGTQESHEHLAEQDASIAAMYLRFASKDAADSSCADAIKNLVRGAEFAGKFISGNLWAVDSSKSDHWLDNRTETTKLLEETTEKVIRQCKITRK